MIVSCGIDYITIVRSPEIDLFFICTFRYTESGDCPGEVSDELFMPIRLSWNLPAPCLEVIQTSLRQAQAIADDVDLHLEVFIRPAPPPHILVLLIHNVYHYYTS